LFLLAEGGHSLGGFNSIDQWPWTWARLLSLIHKIKNVWERVALDPEPENAMPAKWMFFGHDKELDEWFDDRREALKGRDRRRVEDN
jgi:hypothetical protein